MKEKNCKFLFKSLDYNRCHIMLTKAEQNFLYENLSDYIAQDKLENKYVFENVSKLLERTDIRYFNENLLEHISKNLFSRIKSYISNLNEGGARDYNGSGKTEADIVKRKLNIDTYNGTYVVYVNNKPITFDDEDSAVLYCRNNFDIID